MDCLEGFLNVRHEEALQAMQSYVGRYRRSAEAAEDNGQV
jgi:hypothetical protein